MYAMLRTSLKFIDRRSAVSESVLGDFELKGHYVVISFNEIAEKIIKHYLDAGKQVLLIDIDPDVHDVMHEHHENMRCIYADIYDPDTWEELQFAKADAIISCMIGGQEAEVGLLRWQKDMNLNIPFIAATDSHKEAVELYENGAAYVIQTEELAAERFQELLSEYGESLDKLADNGKSHHKSLQDVLKKDTAKFM